MQEHAREERPVIEALKDALASVAGLSPERQGHWVLCATALPDEFAALIANIAWENPEDMLFLDKNLGQKTAAALSGDKKAWQSILEDEKRLFAAFS